MHSEWEFAILCKIFKNRLGDDLRPRKKASWRPQNPGFRPQHGPGERKNGCPRGDAKMHIFLKLKGGSRPGGVRRVWWDLGHSATHTPYRNTAEPLFCSRNHGFPRRRGVQRRRGSEAVGAARVREVGKCVEIAFMRENSRGVNWNPTPLKFACRKSARKFGKLSE